jgi:superfamily I DNA/RNA helicase
MTYRSEIVARMELVAEETRQIARDTGDSEQATRYRVAALRLDRMAEQFKAGDYDDGLMAEYAALTERPDRALDLSRAADEVMVDIGFEDGCYDHPDDVLGEIVKRANL